MIRAASGNYLLRCVRNGRYPVSWPLAKLYWTDLLKAHCHVLGRYLELLEQHDVSES